jgi:UTP--glucose-1-phosphate uridylyltransferase
MHVRKAVITAAGPGQRSLPLQTLVDRDAIEKKALQIILEEATAAGAEEICLIIAPGDRDAYRDAAGSARSRLQFVEQCQPLGYGHALSLAADFTGKEPFLHLVSDHLYLSRGDSCCAQQVAELARAEGCAVSAVQATREGQLPYYGTVGGRRMPRRRDLYEIERVVEKPTPSEAEQHLLVPGLRAGHYLCFFGVHVFTPGVMELLLASSSAGRVQLSPALDALAHRERYLALEVRGRRFNIGVRYGLLMAQLAFALDGADRDNVLTQLVELLALRNREER